MLKPLGDRVVVSVAEQSEKTVGGIVLAANTQEKPVTGKVVATGSGLVADSGQKLDMTVKEGDQVLFDKFAGQELTYNGQSYLALHEKDIIAIVN
ncbi:co-chaperone GroES [Fructobacillus americanaquae]|uniref:Co-chaperonin GroES n=1 Tax=Fructobacillus americanaquae TaxID=2940302 RepID=A0ABY5C0M2_9LACO|nr:co-chaperone GroES [Fructobacillus americanaquae]USS91680.1 co-chaperone GroES [Fructobacillus americanaquae]